jgi:hypothetical protein
MIRIASLTAMSEGRVPKVVSGSRSRVAVATAVVALAGLGASSAWAASTHGVSASGTVKLVKREPATKKIEQRGPITGSPFGRGTLVLRSKLAARRVLEYSIRLNLPGGTVDGTGRANLTASGSQADYRGTVRITGGSGRYRRISRSTLNVSGRGDSTARSTTVRITGSVRY